MKSSGYTVSTSWKPLYEGENVDLVIERDTLEEAINTGLHMSCLAGVITVQVLEGDTIHCDYNREDNLWLTLTSEAKSARGIPQ